jgi:quercetin dioxygenase-like cupin family protein
MALARASSGDLIDVRPLAAELRKTKSHTLVQSPSLEVIRLVLPAGKVIPTHHVPGAITVQCIEGTVEFEVPGRRHTMRCGDLIYLEPALPHALKAVLDASVLITLVHAPRRADC